MAITTLTPCKRPVPMAAPQAITVPLALPAIMHVLKVTTVLIYRPLTVHARRASIRATMRRLAQAALAVNIKETAAFTTAILAPGCAFYLFKPLI